MSTEASERLKPETVEVVQRLQIPGTPFSPKLRAPGRAPFVVSYGALGGVATGAFFQSLPLVSLTMIEILASLICGAAMWERLCARDAKVASMNRVDHNEPKTVIIVKAGK